MTTTEPTGLTVDDSDGRPVAEETALSYPATGPGGRVFDLVLPYTAPDPFIDSCPWWCELAGKHGVSQHDSERVHYGRQIIIPLPSEPVESDQEAMTYRLGHARLYLQREAQEREPRLWIRKDESNVAFDLTIEEARQMRAALDTVLGEVD